jgi:tRNA G10  N-methylase Trm11
MVQILKYNGKTNEQFTRLMVNLAVSACNTNSRKITLLDPMCGKGTTLYEGLIRGYDVKGIEINGQWTKEIETYLIRFLKEGRYKHKAIRSKQSNAKGKKIADVFNITLAADKVDYNDGKTQMFQLFNADTTMANILIKKKSCDMIVSDLPYGVQHKSKDNKGLKTSRSPLELIKVAIPAWNYAIKRNGSIVLSYNEFTMKYKDIAQVLGENGFRVLDEHPYNDYLHRVNQSINRNLIVAVKE